MQHQNNDFTKKSDAGMTGDFIGVSTIDPVEVQRHIARGKQMQNEAIAALLKGVFRRLGSLIPARSRRTPATGAAVGRGEHLSRA